MIQPRPYQLKAAQAIKESLANGVNNQLLQLPTGMGKSVILAMLPQFLELGTRRMLVLVHREELAAQNAEKLRLLNPSRSVGVEMGDQRCHGSNIVVAGIQTLARGKRLEQFDPYDFGILVTDEAHHSTGNSYQRVFDRFDVRARIDILNLGVTATTKRGDGRGLGEVYHKVVYQMTILDAIRAGWLVDLKGVRISTSTDIDGVSITGGDFNAGELASAINTPERNRLVVNAYTDHGEYRPFVAFAEDVQHAKDLALRFRNEGHAVEAVWGSDPDRALKLQQHREGKLRGLVNCVLLSEGYDDWRIQCIIMARPTKSEGLYTQCLGRGSRIPAGVPNLVQALAEGWAVPKKDCIVLDVVDVTKRHTLATMPSLFGLNDKAQCDGQCITKILSKVEEIHVEKPWVDLTEVENLSDLQAYAEQVDLFRVEPPSEIAALSAFQWLKLGSRQYVLSLAGKDHITLTDDLVGKWHVHGNINDYDIADSYPTLEEAIKEADAKVGMLGGKLYHEPTEIDEPVTEPQKEYLRLLGVETPPGTTKGQARRLITKLSAERRRK